MGGNKASRAGPVGGRTGDKINEVAGRGRRGTGLRARSEGCSR
jgi:hypothetical protein